MGPQITHMTNSLWTQADWLFTLSNRSNDVVYMNRLFPYVVLVLLALPTTVLALPDSNQIEFSNCMLALPGTNLTASARCGSLEVAENPAEPAGKRIKLNIAVAPATGKSTEPDPVFFFAGGPGQAASETWVMLRSTLNKIRKSRDIVMIDQRGTGKSNKLACESGTGWRPAFLHHHNCHG